MKLKSPSCSGRGYAAALALFLVGIVTATSHEITNEFPRAVQFELGDAEFAPGDQITIQQVRGTRDAIVSGETYCVEGTYTLSSRDEAQLALYATALSTNSTPVDPKQTVRIRKGTGTFRLIKTMRGDGYLHVSFYPVPSGSSFGGIYFGQGKWTLRNKGWSSVDRSPRTTDPADTGGAGTVSLAGANRTLLEYLGDPVDPPAHLDAAYTKAGLSDALQQAAKNAGVPLRIVEIDESEFPFLIGAVCEENDFEKVKDQIKKMERYRYSGSVGSHTHYAFNLVPYPSFPSESSERISRRLMVRQQMLFDRIIRK